MAATVCSFVLQAVPGSLCGIRGRGAGRGLCPRLPADGAVPPRFHADRHSQDFGFPLIQQFTESTVDLGIWGALLKIK